VPGVVRTKVGYAGGSTLNPTYRSIGDHTETVELEFDPTKVKYTSLLEIFWANHDPTSKCSRQYMSAIFFHDEEQREAAERSLTSNKSSFRKSIKTVLTPATQFYDAEEYHQKYLLQRHPRLCHMLQVEPCGDQLTTSHVLTRVNGYIGGYGSLAEFEKEWPEWGVGEKCADYIRKNMRDSNAGTCGTS